ncbi:Senescence domain-containing protein [Citrus sinensis]|uniref:Senescence domain-containing protein n=1 Tax=Citrus sinensis TaxID=2711 RepID=A0ACB8NS95_CITSI|nr:Senescence domain-containing protein [Citrus sinensis]
MGCFRSRSKNTSAMKSSSASPSNPESRTLKQEVLLRIPGCTVHLMDEGEAIELAKGEFTLVRIFDENVSLATIIKVGDDLQWPLTKDEPVVKLDVLHYLFSLPMKDDEPLSYGVTFSEAYGSSLGLLDSFLREHSCFSGAATSTRKNDIDWKEFAPKIDNYNNVLAKAIAGGTGQIIKGIFKCSNAYTNQVHKGGEMILTQAAEEKNVRKLSKMTNKLSKSMLDVVGVATGSVMAPLVKSQAGKTFFSMAPGEVLLASLDAVNKVLDAAEAAEKQALSATSKAATRAVSERFGESAGEATGDVLATAGHCASTAWNVLKIRKALNPASTVSKGALRNAKI